MAGYRRALEARSIRTPAARLRELAVDEIRPVRVWTARNHNTPPDALDSLADDGDEIVRWNALLNGRMPATALARVARDRHRRRYVVRRLIAHHGNTPGELRRELREDGVCEDCSPECPGWSVYGGQIAVRRSRYEAAGLFRRTEAERADQLLSWQRDDHAFFAAGACHILAWAFTASPWGAGFEIRVIFEPGAAYPVHVYASDGRWAFDHCGWTPESWLLAAYEHERVMTVDVSLEEFCARYWHRLPEQYAHSPWERARAYVARYNA